MLTSHLSDEDASQQDGAAQFPRWTLWWGQSWLSLTLLLQEGKLHPLSAREKVALRQDIQVLAGGQVSLNQL